MAFPRPYYLTAEQVRGLFSAYDPAHQLEVVRIRRKNKQEIRRPESMAASELERWIIESMESGWSFDMDVFLPATGQTLIGHHDGVYWLESPPA